MIGSVQAFGLACGFVFLSLDSGIFESLESLLFGSILGITRGQVLTAGGRRGRPGVLPARRPAPALRDGRRGARPGARPQPRALATAFLLVLGLAVAATAQITGVLLVFALLVAPPATAQLLTGRIGLGLVASVLIGLTVTWLGLGLAYFTDYPVGFYVTTLALAGYLPSRPGASGPGGRRG